MLPRRGLDEFVTGSAAPPAAAKGKDAPKKDEKAVDASASGRSWQAAELRRMYRTSTSCIFPLSAFSLFMSPLTRDTVA